jgi:myosin heavy subunit
MLSCLLCSKTNTSLCFSCDDKHTICKSCGIKYYVQVSSMKGTHTIKKLNLSFGPCPMKNCKKQFLVENILENSDYELDLEKKLFQERKVNELFSKDYYEKEKELKKTKEELAKTKEELSKTKEEITKTKEEITKTKEEVSRTKEEVSRTKEEYEEKFRKLKEEYKKKLEEKEEDTIKIIKIKKEKKEEMEAKKDDEIKNITEERNSLKRKFEELEETLECNICMERKVDTTLLPCMHCYCEKCCKKVTFCPYCNEKIKEKRKIFI